MLMKYLDVSKRRLRMKIIITCCVFVLWVGLANAQWYFQSSWVSDLLESVFFTDTNNGWVVGWNGVILHTTNGGNKWTPQISGTSKNLHSVHFPDDSNGWAVGEDGTILHTTNEGIEWSFQSSGTSGYLTSVFFTDTSNGWAVGWQYGPPLVSIILHTEDGGNSWFTQLSDSGGYNYILSVYFIDTNKGWAVGGAGYFQPNDWSILHTKDGGDTWTTDWACGFFTSVFFLDSSNGWATVEDDINTWIRNTKDGGNT